MAQKKQWSRRLTLAGGAAAAFGLGAYAFRRPGGTGFDWSKGDPRILRRGNDAEPTTLDPHKAANIWEDWIIGDMMVGLMHQDAKGDPIPCACEGYSASADGLTYTIRLREHLWSDGVPVTADDYVFSFRRIADPRTAAQYVSILFPIVNMEAAAAGKVPPEAVGVRALDARTLEMRFNFQVPYIGQLLMHETTYAVPRHVVEKHGDNWVRPENIATNGPFILKEWVPNDHVLLVKNPRFYDAANVHFEKIYFYPTQDVPAALKRFRAGELDLVNRCPPTTEVPILKREIPHEIRISPCVANYFLPINVHVKPFDDIRVREALSLAVDRRVITDKVMRVGQLPAYNLMPPGMPGYPYSARMRFADMPMAARRARARALLAAAGFGPDNPLSFDFSMFNTSDFKRIAVALQAMWGQVGVTCNLVAIDTQVLYDMLRKRDFAIAIGGWIADYRDPKNFAFLFESTTTDLNWGGYSNPRYDALVAASDHIRDPAKRLETLAEAEQILLDDVAIVTLLHDVNRDTVSPQVKGWIGNPINVNRSRWLSIDRSDVSV